ncbi:MAG TPA: hypothetical protein VFQ38_18670 [Longimicrobiales bacterium]|nr:hypothetical protein [Longimicrobiales bacterium]
MRTDPRVREAALMGIGLGSLVAVCAMMAMAAVVGLDGADFQLRVTQVFALGLLALALAGLIRLRRRWSGRRGHAHGRRRGSTRTGGVDPDGFAALPAGSDAEARVARPAGTEAGEHMARADGSDAGARIVLRGGPGADERIALPGRPGDS